jgi:hypothetical protein
MRHFSKANWSALNTIRLGSYLLMQIIAKLETKGANTYPELDSTALNICILVIDDLSR